MGHSDGRTSELLLCWRGELGWDGGGIGFEDPGHSRGGRATHPMKEISALRPLTRLSTHPSDPPRSMNRLPLRGWAL